MEAPVGPGPLPRKNLGAPLVMFASLWYCEINKLVKGRQIVH